LYDHVTLCGQHDSGTSWLVYVHGTLVIDTLSAWPQYKGKLYESLYTYVTLCGQHDSGTYCLVYIHCATVVGTPGHSLALHAIQRDIVWKLGLCMIFVWGIWNKYQIWRVRTCMRWISLLNGLSGNVKIRIGASYSETLYTYFPTPGVQNSCTHWLFLSPIQLSRTLSSVFQVLVLVFELECSCTFQSCDEVKAGWRQL